jgi:hypothetical protein
VFTAGSEPKNAFEQRPVFVTFFCTQFVPAPKRTSLVELTTKDAFSDATNFQVVVVAAACAVIMPSSEEAASTAEAVPVSVPPPPQALMTAAVIRARPSAGAGHGRMEWTELGYDISILAKNDSTNASPKAGAFSAGSEKPTESVRRGCVENALTLQLGSVPDTSVGAA